jgi:predicted amidohydrolase YtcJ
LITPSLLNAQERLLVNAKVFTANPLHPYSEAVALRDNKIVAVGSRAEAAASLGASAEIIDLAGKTLLPGLIDSHNHAIDGGVTLITVDAPETLATVDELATIAAAAKASGKGMFGDVLVVTGIPLAIWSKNEELNARFNTGAFADQPVMFEGMDYHTGWANLSLRKKAGLDQAFIAKLSKTEQAYYGLDNDQNPNGFVVDAGKEVLEKQVPHPDRKRMLEAARAAVDSLHSLGITSWVDPAASEAILTAYADLAKEKGLTAHVAAFPVVHPNDPDALVQVRAFRKQFADVPNLTVPGLKVFADGVAEFPSQTAAMAAPYRVTGKTGELLFEPANFQKMCIQADKEGLIIHVHAIGDRAVTEALNGIEAARKANGNSGLPHTITHLQFVKPTDIDRFHELGVIAAYQLYWAIAGTDTIDILQPYVDPEIYKWQYPARSMLDAGATISGASDWPVSTANPFLAIYNAETRKGPKGVLDASQDMPREAMLYAYTINAARAMNQEKILGSIEPGKLADLTLVDRDVLTVSPEEARETKVLWTMANGAFVYRAPAK